MVLRFRVAGLGGFRVLRFRLSHSHEAGKAPHGSISANTTTLADSLDSLGTRTQLEPGYRKLTRQSPMPRCESAGGSFKGACDTGSLPSPHSFSKERTVSHFQHHRTLATGHTCTSFSCTFIQCYFTPLGLSLTLYSKQQLRHTQHAVENSKFHE